VAEIEALDGGLRAKQRLAAYVRQASPRPGQEAWQTPGPSPDPEAAESALKLTRTERRRLQQALNVLDFCTAAEPLASVSAGRRPAI